MFHVPAAFYRRFSLFSDTADALLGDDSDDREDYDLGKEEEAKLLYGDDGEEDWKGLERKLTQLYF